MKREELILARQEAEDRVDAAIAALDAAEDQLAEIRAALTELDRAEGVVASPPDRDYDYLGSGPPVADEEALGRWRAAVASWPR